MSLEAMGQMKNLISQVRLPGKIATLKGGLIVSCQALADEPLHGGLFMCRMAQAAQRGGAAGIRANSVVDITAIKQEVDLPVIGLIKQNYLDSEIYITPTLPEVDALVAVGTDIIATDFTQRPRPGGRSLAQFIKAVRAKYPQQLIMADISTFEEGLVAAELKADLISTTLSGYTSYSPKSEGPDLELVRQLSQATKIPVIAEGRIHYPEQARAALEYGAYAVVVGGAITRPMEITERFVQGMKTG